MTNIMKKLVALAVVTALPLGGFAATKKSKKKYRKVKKEVTAEKASPWGFAFATENTKSAATANESFEGLGALAVSYKFDDKNSLGFVSYYTFTWDDINPAQSDVAIKYAHSHDKLPGNISFDTQYRLYLPVSESSRELGKYQGRFYASLSNDINKTWSYSLITNPRVFAYSNDQRGQTKLMLINEAAITAKVNDSLGLSTAIGHIHVENNDGLKANNDISYYLLDDPFAFDDSMYITLSADLTIDKFSFAARVDQTTNLRDDDSYSLFKGSQTTYIIEFGVSI